MRRKQTLTVKYSRTNDDEDKSFNADLAIFMKSHGWIWYTQDCSDADRSMLFERSIDDGN